jgi:hypothetical protein
LTNSSRSTVKEVRCQIPNSRMLLHQGDHEAFRALMRRYNRLLYRTARSILKDETDAEDALQADNLLNECSCGRSFPCAAREQESRGLERAAVFVHPIMGVR